ncbi:hypothetical protein DL93DRAFT_2172961 [Clavulina sp. PMI_390]|nr:hypothetical protein DL93DRAFT_2172961 [Clavulina sp. PMI_390]
MANFVRRLANAVSGDAEALHDQIFPQLEILRVSHLSYIEEGGLSRYVQDNELAPALSAVLDARPSLSVIVDSLTMWEDEIIPVHLRSRVSVAGSAPSVKITLDNYM